jgi:hypothetical protein
VGPDGAPIPLASLTHDAYRWGTHTVEVHDGRFEYGELKKEAWFEAKRPRTAAGAPLPYGPARVGPVAPLATEVEVSLPPERRIEGVVKDPAGAFVRGVRVRATPVETKPAFGGHVDEHGSARTDEQGRFRLGNLGDGSYRIDVTPPPEYGPTPPQTVAAGATDVVIALVAGRVASPTILDPRGRPVPGATVLVQEARPNAPRPHSHGVVFVPGGDRSSRYYRQLVTDARGVVRFVGIPADGKYALDVTPPEDRPDLRETQVSPWTPSDDAVTLGAGLVLRGFVRDTSGRAVPGADVAAEGAGKHYSAESRSDGRFTIGGMLEGDVKVRATKHGEFGGESAAVQARAGTDGVVLVLDPGAEVHVRIEGWPPDASYEWVALTADGEEDGKWSRVLADGTATFRGCSANATYSLVVRLEGPPPRVGALRDLRPGPTPARMTLGPGRAITGTVKVPPGAAGLALYASGPGLWVDGSVDAEGKFTIPALPEGVWKVAVSARVGGQAYSASGDAAAGGSIDLVLEPAGAPAPGGAPEAACGGGGKCG